MSTIHEQTIDLRELPTKTVTLYPQKAEIVREIGDVKLKPGINEINIIGITPIADEGSIKVEAHGSTIVTDMVIDLIANPDSFEDIYLSDSGDTSGNESDTGDMEMPQTVKDLEMDLEKHHQELQATIEVISSNEQSLQILEKLIDMLDLKKSEELDSTLDIYQKRRSTFYANLERAREAKSTQDKTIGYLETRKFKLQMKHEKEVAKIALKKEKAFEKKLRAQAKENKNKKRDLIEKAKFWPKSVYNIRVTIELSVLTPGTSRRESFDSLATANTIHTGDATQGGSSVTNLLLLYIVQGASWTPKYDLSISTITQTGVMNYRAEIENTTSETWRDAKVILSTSRATFSGVSEPIPVIKPWLLHLVKSAAYRNGGPNPTWSTQEKEAMSSNHKKSDEKAMDVSRDKLFGVPRAIQHRLQGENHAQNNNQFARQIQQAQAPVSNPLLAATYMSQQQMFQSTVPCAVEGAEEPLSGGPEARSGGLADSEYGNKQKKLLSYKSVRARGNDYSKDESAPAYDEDDIDPDNGDSENLNSETSWEESGLTTTVEVRGIRTIPPSSSTRRFKIATVRLNQLSLTHMVVPKLRPEAFLRARIVNTSTSALLKGSAGLTLDGTFLGHTTIPRCSAGENFPLPLGIDPAIIVSYPTPVSRKNLSAGMFTKELSSTFTRAVILTNTRSEGGSVSAAAAAVVNLTVRDQIPVSEDERLKIDILYPKGLHEEGDKVKAGTELQAARTAKITQAGVNTGSSGGSISRASSDQPWGQAIAKLNKSGAVEWTVNLNAGKSVLLKLEYMLRFPGTDRVAEVSGGSSSFHNTN